MLLEKLKQHGVKIMFFVMNLSVVASGVFFINQKKTEKATLAAAELDAQQYKSMVDYALNAQQLILSNKADKINSVVNNSGTVNRQQSVPVVKTIPAVTKTITVQQPVASSSSSSTKTTTKKS